MGDECEISELSRLYNVSLRTLRFYEDRELLRPRREGFRRLYSETDRRRLEIILLGKRLGFSLAAISEILATLAMTETLAMTDMPAQRSASVDMLRLSREQIVLQLDRLSLQRARVQAAIDELRSTAAGAADHGSPHSEPML